MDWIWFCLVHPMEARSELESGEFGGLLGLFSCLAPSTVVSGALGLLVPFHHDQHWLFLWVRTDGLNFGSCKHGWTLGACDPVTILLVYNWRSALFSSSGGCHYVMADWCVNLGISDCEKSAVLY